ncbi:MAG: hypothetical protein WAV32_04480 [Halobacteriota archaeon]
MWSKYIRQFAASTDAQAFAIGAVILLGIAVTAATIYLAINAPIKTKECEFQHSIKVSEDFVLLNSTINLMSSTINSRILNKKPEEVSERRSTISSFVHINPLTESVPIKLKPTRDSIIALPLASGTISFLPTKGDITVRLTEKDGNGNPGTRGIANFVSSPSPNWNFSRVDEAGYNGDVTATSGNITLEGPPYVSACIVSNMTNITGNIGFDTGSNSTVYGNITWYVEDVTAEKEIILKVRTDMYPEMRTATATEWNKCYGIESGKNGLNSFPLPDLYTVSNGHRYVQFRAELKTENSQETPKLINVSIHYKRENVTLAKSAGIIRYNSSYHYLPDYAITYENGAVMKRQEKENGELVQGPFNLIPKDVSNDSMGINLTLVNLTGADVSGIAGGFALIRLRLMNRERVSDSLYYPNLTILINSSCPRACGNWFNKTFKKTLLNASYYNVTVNDTTGTVELDLHAHGIKLHLDKITLGVEL